MLAILVGRVWSLTHRIWFQGSRRWWDFRSAIRRHAFSFSPMPLFILWSTLQQNIRFSHCLVPLVPSFVSKTIWVACVVCDDHGRPSASNQNGFECEDANDSKSKTTTLASRSPATSAEFRHSFTTPDSLGCSAFFTLRHPTQRPNNNANSSNISSRLRPLPAPPRLVQITPIATWYPASGSETVGAVSNRDGSIRREWRHMGVGSRTLQML